MSVSDMLSRHSGALNDFLHPENEAARAAEYAQEQAEALALRQSRILEQAKHRPRILERVNFVTKYAREALTEAKMAKANVLAEAKGRPKSHLGKSVEHGLLTEFLENRSNGVPLYIVGRLGVNGAGVQVEMGVAKPVVRDGSSTYKNLGEVMSLGDKEFQLKWLETESTSDPRIVNIMHGTDAVWPQDVELTLQMLDGMPASIDVIKQAALGYDLTFLPASAANPARQLQAS